MAMPKVDRTKLNTIIADFTQEEKDIVSLVVKKNDFVRATKPKVDDADPATGKAAYVWRMVAFMVSTNPKHHCMPCTADFDLPAFNNEYKWKCELAQPMAKELKRVEDAILSAIPKTQWAGAIRWGRAFGQL